MLKLTQKKVYFYHNRLNRVCDVNWIVLLRTHDDDDGDGDDDDDDDDDDDEHTKFNHNSENCRRGRQEQEEGEEGCSVVATEAATGGGFWSKKVTPPLLAVCLYF